MMKPGLLHLCNLELIAFGGSCAWLFRRLTIFAGRVCQVLRQIQALVRCVAGSHGHSGPKAMREAVMDVEDLKQ